MSHSTNTLKNKNQKQSETFLHYLMSLKEPWDVVSRDTPRELEYELVESTRLMKQRIRRAANKMRKQYS